MLALFVVHDASAQGLVGSLLFARSQCGVHVQATGVGIAAILGKHQLTGHFCNVLSMYLAVVAIGADFELLLLGSFSLLFRNEAITFHALDDVELACACPFGVVDGVVRRWGLGQ